MVKIISGNQIFRDGTKAVSDAHMIATQNAHGAQTDVLYIRTNTKYAEGKFGNTALQLSAAIEEDMAESYAHVLSQAERSEIMSEYYSQVEKLFGGTTDAFSFKSMLDKVFSNIHDIHNKGNANIVKSLDALAKKINKIHNSLQELRGQVDQRIEKTTLEINKILSDIRENNEILRNQQNKQNEQLHINTKKKMWSDINELSKKLAISRQPLNDGTYEINVLTSEQKYNLIGRSGATEFIYKSDGVSRIASDEPFNPIVLRKLGMASKTLYAVDDFVVVSSGSTAEDTEYKIKDGVFGALLEVRDTVIPQAIKKINEFAVQFMHEMNILHNKLSPYPGSSLLSGSNRFSLNTLMNARGHARIAIIDNHGNPLKNQDDGFIPLELNLSQLPTIGTNQINVQSIITKINDYFSSENRRVEVSGIYDVKLVSKSRAIDTRSTLELGIEITNSFTDSHTGFTVNGIKVVNQDGVELAAHTSLGQQYMISGDSRQRLIEGLNIEVDNGRDVHGNILNSVKYPYTVELEIQTQSKFDRAPVFSKIFYTISDPDHYEKSVNGMFGRSFSAYSVENASHGEVANPIKLKYTNASNVLSANLVNQEGAIISDPHHAGFLQLRTSIGQYKIAIYGLENIEGNPHNADEMSTDFSNFFGLNNLFKMKEHSNDRASSHAARDMAVRQDIIRDSKLFSYSTLSAKKNPYSSSLEQASFYNYGVESGKAQILDEGWSRAEQIISKSSGQMLYDVVYKAKNADLTRKNYIAVQDGIEAELNTLQGVPEGQLNYDLFQLTTMQSILSQSFAATTKIMDIFLNTFK